MAENTDLRLTLEAWAAIVIKEWIRMVQALNINNTGALVASFDKYVHGNTGGDPDKVSFIYEWYGKMVDYGVGKGVMLMNRDLKIAAGKTQRRPKPFYTDTFYKQLAVLRHLMEEKHALRAELFIQQNLNDNAELAGYKKIEL
jgi:hypothetical protein